MYADRITDSMRRAIDETNRRRAIQRQYNEEHGITPRGIQKEVRALSDRFRATEEEGEAVDGLSVATLPKDEIARMIKTLESQMKQAAKGLEFEKAAQLRDQVVELRRALVE